MIKQYSSTDSAQKTHKKYQRVISSVSDPSVFPSTFRLSEDGSAILMKDLTEQGAKRVVTVNKTNLDSKDSVYLQENKILLRDDKNKKTLKKIRDIGNSITHFLIPIDIVFFVVSKDGDIDLELYDLDSIRVFRHIEDYIPILNRKSLFRYFKQFKVFYTENPEIESGAYFSKLE